MRLTTGSGGVRVCSGLALLSNAWIVSIVSAELEPAPPDGCNERIGSDPHAAERGVPL